jgi:excinuclease ABC subunit C
MTKLTSLSLTKIPFAKANVSQTEKQVGVYVFWDEKREPLYVGKSTNLRNRLDSYLGNDLDVKTTAMVSNARYYSTIAVTSELESLLLESFLVKTNQPKYNIELKDDKSPLYIKITNDEFPTIRTARKADIETEDTAVYFGPFPSSSNVKMILKILRRVFPYAQHIPMKRSCLYAQMNLCKPCPSEIVSIVDPDLRLALKRKYRKNIRYIKMVLSGKTSILKRNIQKEMAKAASEENFEEAKALRGILEKLDYITQPVNEAKYFLENPNLREDIRKKEMVILQMIVSKFMTIPKQIVRVECFDIAHIGGSYPTASMVTFMNGESDKRFYRHFKIQQKKGNDDYASLHEVALRRKKHFADWGTPDLIIVDGGKGQLRMFREAMADTPIPIISLAKRFETLVIPGNDGIHEFHEVRVPEGPVLNFVQRIRDEAHRFARRLHHKLVSKSITSA